MGKQARDVQYLLDYMREPPHSTKVPHVVMKFEQLVKSVGTKIDKDLNYTDFAAVVNRSAAYVWNEAAPGDEGGEYIVRWQSAAQWLDPVWDGFAYDRGGDREDVFERIKTEGWPRKGPYDTYDPPNSSGMAKATHQVMTTSIGKAATSIVPPPAPPAGGVGVSFRPQSTTTLVSKKAAPKKSAPKKGPVAKGGKKAAVPRKAPKRMPQHPLTKKFMSIPSYEALTGKKWRPRAKKAGASKAKAAAPDRRAANKRLAAAAAKREAKGAYAMGTVTAAKKFAKYAKENPKQALIDLKTKHRRTFHVAKDYDPPKGDFYGQMW